MESGPNGEIVSIKSEDCEYILKFEGERKYYESTTPNCKKDQELKKRHSPFHQLDLGYALNPAKASESASDYTVIYYLKKQCKEDPKKKDFNEYVRKAQKRYNEVFGSSPPAVK